VAIPDIWKAQLREGLEQQGIALDEPRQQSLLAYLGLLQKWNGAYNLTAVRDPEVMVSRQLLDSLSILPWVSTDNLLDVGSGGGLPGIPLAIARPDMTVVMVDSNSKKTRFLTQCVLELGLGNVTVVQGRAEDVPLKGYYRQVTSRAFTALANLVQWCDHLLAEDGEFLAMKGQYPQEEIDDLPSGWQVREEHRLQVPGSDGERHLLLVERTPR